MGGFRERGVVEGHYGTPWCHRDRLWLIERIGGWGMNRYVYAPKDDPLHRARWREPYPDTALSEFEELVASGARVGVEVGFALSPGRSIRYASSEERAALLAKFRVFRELGSSWLMLALDDVPSSLAHAEDRDAFSSLAEAHVELAGELQQALGPEVTLCVVPTDYLGVEPTPYLDTLGRGLDSAILLAWTGRTVISPSITGEEAARRAATLRRPVLIWDNVPVADGPMRSMLHLGPYGGRDPELAQHVCGVLLNPMAQVRASAIVLRTAAAYLANPRAYEPEAAWRDALEEAGEGDAEALMLFARAQRCSPLWPDDRDAELEAAFQRLRRVLGEDGDPAHALAELREQLEARLELHERIRKGVRDTRLVHELEPWLASHRRETLCMEAALKALEAFFAPLPQSAKVFAFFAFQGRLASEPPTGKASYGPRRVLYPQLASLGDETMAFGADDALVRDRCLTDEVIRLVEELALARLGRSAREGEAG